MDVFPRGVVFVLAAGLIYATAGQAVPNPPPAVTVSTPERVLEVNATDVCGVDFRNIRMFGEFEEDTAKLKNGKYERQFDSGRESVSLKHVFCINHGTNHAIVITDWVDCGGSCSSVDVVQLFTIRLSRPVITQQFVFDSHAVGTGATFNPESLTLTITGRSDDHSANCCPTSFDVVTYRWQGTKFVQTNFTRVPAPPRDRTDSDKAPSVP